MTRSTAAKRGLPEGKRRASTTKPTKRRGKIAGWIKESLSTIWPAETATKQHRMKDLYDLTKKLAGKKSSTSKPIKYKHGNTLIKQGDQLRRWGKYFEELLKRPPPPIPVAIPEAALVLDVNTAKPSN